MKKEIKKLMKKNDFTLIRTGKHHIWQHEFTKKKVTTSTSPSRGNALNMIKSDIRSVLRDTNYKLAA